MPEVSVVIPTHNRCELLKNSLTSVLNQTYNDYEIIIIDDASSDNTKEYIESLNLDKIKYLRNNVSLGGNKSRNEGIKVSSGKFIAFLDDDDEWMPDKLQMQMKIFNSNHSAALVYTGVKIVFTDLNVSYSTKPKVRGKVYENMLLRNHIGVTPSVVVKKEALLECRGFDESMPARQDYDLWLRICKNYEIDYVIEPLTLSYARLNVKRISSDLSKYEEAMTKIDNKYSEDISRLSHRDQQLREKEKYFFLGSQAIKINNASLARKYFFKSLKIKFSVSAFASFFMSLFGAVPVLYMRKWMEKIRG